MADYTIRKYSPEDFDDVVAIAKATTREDRSEVFNAAGRAGLCVDVLECRSEIIGYAVYRTLRKRIHIVEISIALPYPTAFWLRVMLKHISGKLDPDERCDMTIDLPEASAKVQVFLRDFGFRFIQKCGRNDDGDIYLLSYAIPAEPAAKGMRHAASS